MNKRSFLVAAGLVLTTGATTASAPDNNAGALTPSVDLRLRSEAVHQDGPLQSAIANTLRYRLGLHTPTRRGLSAHVETEGVSIIGSDDYNSGPGGNGRTGRSVIADPSGNELNQAFVSYTHPSSLSVRLGRQRLIYDNARFIGNVGWRQNEQTMDGLALKFHAGSRTTLQYAHIQNVNRIFFSDAALNGHLFNASWTLLPALSATAYGYLLDFDKAEDSQTLGVHLHGRRTSGEITWRYGVEYASQDTYAEAPTTVDADYRRLHLSASKAGWTFAAGQEVLSGNGLRGFSTPLATLHKFNGWADIFLSTPPDGLDDRYFQLGHGAGRINALARYHLFSAENTAQRYGEELDLLLGWKWTRHTSVKLKLASYRASSWSVDTDKAALQVDFSL